MDAVIVAVAHGVFKEYTIEDTDCFFGKGQKVLLDVKGIFDREKYLEAGYNYWRL